MAQRAHSFASDDDASFVCHSGPADVAFGVRRRDSDLDGPARSRGPSGTPSTPLASSSPNVTTRTPRMLTPLTRGGQCLAHVLCTPQPSTRLLEMQSQMDEEVDEVSSHNRRSGQPNVTKLFDDIFVGGIPSPQELRDLHAAGVRTVVTVCGGDAAARSGVEGIDFVSLPCRDAPDYFILVSDYDEFAAAMDAALTGSRGVYVHCVAGVNRSVTLVAAYLIQRLGYTPLSAVRLFHQRGRTVILDNRSFRRQLIEFFLELPAPQPPHLQQP